MVALLDPSHDVAPFAPADRRNDRRSAGRGDGRRRTTAAARPQASRAHLRLVESPPHEPSSWGVPVAGIAVAVVVVFGLLAVVRFSQGAPPEATWAELGGDSRGQALALAGPGDHLDPTGATYVVQPGDSYWSIAVALAPNADPRGTVDRLREANGGSSALDAGQLIAIPVELLPGEGGLVAAGG